MKGALLFVFALLITLGHSNVVYISASIAACTIVGGVLPPAAQCSLVALNGGAAPTSSDDVIISGASIVGYFGLIIDSTSTYKSLTIQSAGAILGYTTVAIQAALTVSGNLTVAAAQTLTISNSLTVQGYAEIQGNVQAQYTTSFTGGLDVAAQAALIISASTMVAVQGSVNLAGSVVGAASTAIISASQATISLNAKLNATLDLTGNVAVNVYSDVTSLTYLTVTGASNVFNITKDSLVTIQSGLSVATSAVLTVYGSMDVYAAAAISGRLQLGSSSSSSSSSDTSNSNFYGSVSASFISLGNVEVSFFYGATVTTLVYNNDGPIVIVANNTAVFTTVLVLSASSVLYATGNTNVSITSNITVTTENDFTIAGNATVSAGVHLQNATLAFITGAAFPGGIDSTAMISGDVAATFDSVFGVECNAKVSGNIYLSSGSSVLLSGGAISLDGNILQSISVGAYSGLAIEDEAVVSFNGNVQANLIYFDSGSLSYIGNIGSAPNYINASIIIDNQASVQILGAYVTLSNNNPNVVQGQSSLLFASGTIMVPSGCIFGVQNASSFQVTFASSSNPVVTVASGATLVLAQGSSMAVQLTTSLVVQGTFQIGLLYNDGSSFSGSFAASASSNVTVVSNAFITATSQAAGSFYLNAQSNFTVAAGAGFTASNAIVANGNTTVAGTFTGAQAYTQAQGNLILQGGRFIASQVSIATSASTSVALRGSGVIVASVTVNAVIAAGFSPGTIYISGDLILNSGSTTRLDIEQAAYDIIYVGGKVQHGGSLDVTLGYSPATGSLFSFIRFNGTGSGTFNAIVPANAGTVLYGSQNTTLQYTNTATTSGSTSSGAGPNPTTTTTGSGSSGTTTNAPGSTSSTSHKSSTAHKSSAALLTIIAIALAAIV